MANCKRKYDNDDHLNILHLDIDNLTTKSDSFRLLISKLSDGRPLFHVIAVSETHLRNEKGKSNQTSLSDEEVNSHYRTIVLWEKVEWKARKVGVGSFIEKTFMTI
jgi:hypothetical protein